MKSSTFETGLISGFHVTSLSPCWWTKTKDLSLASFVRPPATTQYITSLLSVSLEIGYKPPIKRTRCFREAYTGLPGTCYRKSEGTELCGIELQHSSL